MPRNPLRGGGQGAYMVAALRPVRRSSHRLAVALLAAALAPGCTVQRDQPDLVGQDVRLTIIHTSDIHSRLFPYYLVPNRFDQGYGLLPTPTVGTPEVAGQCLNQVDDDGDGAINDGCAGGIFGGLARIATIVHRERARANRSLWLDSGDAFQGAPVFNLFHGEAEVRSLSLAGLDAAAVGNHEFDQGSANLQDQIENWADYPFLAANYLFDDPPDPDRGSLGDLVPPYVVFDVGGIKIGVIGMANWSSMTSIFEGGNSLGVRALYDAQVLDQYVRLLRPTVDVLVVASHLGLDEDEGLAQNPDVDEGVGLNSIPLEGVDLVLGGHLHIVLDPPKVLPHEDGSQTLLVHSGAFAKFVGRLDLVVHIGEDNSDPDKRSRITAFSYDVIPVDLSVPQDRDVANLLWPYSVAINQAIDLDGVLAYSDIPAGDKITRADLSGGDSQLGNMVARSMQVRSGVEAEFAMTNSLGIRADFEQGPLTIEQMFNVFPFENQITVMYLSGSEIQETLDFVARKSSGRGCRAQAQVAGLFFDMVCSGSCPDGRTACAKNIVIGDDCRLGGDPSADIDPAKCPPIDPHGLYRVAVNDYISRGGSGFEVLKRNSSKQDTGISLRDATIDFLRRQDKCTDPTIVEQYGNVACLDKTIEPHEGRIRAVFE